MDVKCKRAPVSEIFIFDNEQVSDRPLKKFLNHLNNKGLLESSNYNHIQDNLYILTNPLVNGKKNVKLKIYLMMWYFRIRLLEKYFQEKKQTMKNIMVKQFFHNMLNGSMTA